MSMGQSGGGQLRTVATGGGQCNTGYPGPGHCHPDIITLESGVEAKENMIEFLIFHFIENIVLSLCF